MDGSATAACSISGSSLQQTDVTADGQPASRESSSTSDYQEWAEAEPSPIYADDLREQQQVRIRRQLQLDVLASFKNPELRQQLTPAVLGLKVKQLTSLAALNILQRADMDRCLAACVSTPRASQQEFLRWVNMATNKDRAARAARQQQQQRQHFAQAAREKVQAWRADARWLGGRAADRPWQDKFLSRYEMAMPFLEPQATPQVHHSHTHLFKRYLIDSRWASFPYWHEHPPAQPAGAVPQASLGDASSCGLCCEALNIRRQRPSQTSDGVQHSRLNCKRRLFGGCFGLTADNNNSATPAPSNTAGSTVTARPHSPAAQLSLIAGRGQNWETDFMDPAKALHNTAVRDTFGGLADSPAAPQGSGQGGNSSRTFTAPPTRGSSIYWESYVLPSSPGSMLPMPLEGPAEGSPGLQRLARCSRSLKHLFNRPEAAVGLEGSKLA